MITAWEQIAPGMHLRMRCGCECRVESRNGKWITINKWRLHNDESNTLEELQTGAVETFTIESFNVLLNGAAINITAPEWFRRKYVP